MFFCSFVFILLLATVTKASTKLSCLNGNGEAVDWWFIYKQSDGLGYVYLDSAMNEPQKMKGGILINDNDSPLVRTIASANFPEIPQNARIDEPFYVTWNDQTASNGASSNSRTNAKKAHSKGFLGLKRNQAPANDNQMQNDIHSAFFIQHTLPRFPVRPSGTNKTIFSQNIDASAQHFMCITLDESQPSASHSAAQKLLFHYATVGRVNFYPRSSEYPWEGADCLKEGFGVRLRALLEGKLTKSSKVNKKVSRFTLRSTGGETERLQFVVFCKAPAHQIDIYDDLTSLLSIGHEAYNNFEVKSNESNESNESTASSIQSSMQSSSISPSQNTQIYNSVMIAQSYVDPSMLGVNYKILLSSDDYKQSATVQIVNSNWVMLPKDESTGKSASKSKKSTKSTKSKVVVLGALSSTFIAAPEDLDEGEDVEVDSKLPPGVLHKITEHLKGRPQRSHMQLSRYKDHSKWSVNMRHGDSGPFWPLLCFYDLNRTAKQSTRGGAAFCLNSGLTGVTPAGLKLWSFFVNLRPRLSDSGQFLERNVRNTVGEAILSRESELGEWLENAEVEFGQLASSTPSSQRKSQVFPAVPVDIKEKWIIAFDLFVAKREETKSSRKRHRDEDEDERPIKRTKTESSTIHRSNVNSLSEMPSITSLFELENKEFVVQIEFQGHTQNLPCLYRYTSKQSNIKKDTSLPYQKALMIGNSILMHGMKGIIDVARACGFELTATAVPVENNKNMRSFTTSGVELTTKKTSEASAMRLSPSISKVKGQLRFEELVADGEAVVAVEEEVTVVAIEGETVEESDDEFGRHTYSN